MLLLKSLKNYKNKALRLAIVIWRLKRLKAMLWTNFGRSMDITTILLLITWKRHIIKELNKREELNKRIKKLTRLILVDRNTMTLINWRVYLRIYYAEIPTMLLWKSLKKNLLNNYCHTTKSVNKNWEILNILQLMSTLIIQIQDAFLLLEMMVQKKISVLLNVLEKSRIKTWHDCCI